MSSDATTDENDNEITEGCGYEWDHTLRLIGEHDGVRSYECTECGTEIHEDDEVQA